MLRYLLKSVGLYIIYIYGYIRGKSVVMQKTPPDVEFTETERYETMRKNVKKTLDTLIYKKMEELIERMTHYTSGVRMTTSELSDGTVPPVFQGKNLIKWMIANMENVNEGKALYLANVLATHGYIFPVDKYHIKVENNDKYYRFQSSEYWYSNKNNPRDYDYAIYLAKRTLEKNIELKLDHYEEQKILKLRKMYTHNWMYVVMQAETDFMLTKENVKNSDEKKKLDSEERTFWNVHRPNPSTEKELELNYDNLLSYKEINKWNIINDRYKEPSP